MNRIPAPLRLLAGFLLALLLSLPAAARSGPPQTLRQDLIRCIRYDKTVNVEQYHATEAQVTALFLELRNAGELPWYAYSYQYTSRSGIVTSVSANNLDPERYDYDLYEQTLRQILSDTITDGMTAWQKALVLHDYLAAHCRYDESLTFHEGYDALIRGTAVCSGYARAYQDLMNLAGVPCRYVGGNHDQPPGHAWNLVKIGSSWYHVDVTWDDPLPDIEGRVLHRHFLLTDREMVRLAHFEWNSGLLCSDDRFSGGFWREIESPVCLASADKGYVLRSDGERFEVLAMNPMTHEERQLHLLQRECTDLGDGCRIYPHWGLSLYKDRLYFGSLEAVWSIKPDGSDLQMVFTLSSAATGQYIRGFSLDRGTLRLTLSDREGRLTRQSLRLELPEGHIHRYQTAVTPPDCHWDGFTRYTCSCGLSYDSRFTEKTAHQYVLTDHRDPTREREGFDRFRCSLCGRRHEVPIPRLPHVHRYRASFLAPTCTEDGATLYTCSCGNSFCAYLLPAQGHRWGPPVLRETDDGREAEFCCTVCGARRTAPAPARSGTVFWATALPAAAGGLVLLFLLYRRKHAAPG